MRKPDPSKLMRGCIAAVCAILALLIFLKLILPPLGLTVTYKMPITEVFVAAAVSVAAILSAILRLYGEKTGVCAIILFPMTVAFWMIVSIFFGNVGRVWWIPILSSSVAAVSFGFGKGRFATKALCGVLALLMVPMLFIFTTVTMIFGDVAKRTVLARADSPYSDISAELIEIDTGALGADYYIEVWENSADVNLGFAVVSTNRESITTRDYYRAEIQMEFTDEDTITVNGDKYKVG